MYIFTFPKNFKIGLAQINRKLSFFSVCLLQCALNKDSTIIQRYLLRCNKHRWNDYSDIHYKCNGVTLHQSIETHL